MDSESASPKGSLSIAGLSLKALSGQRRFWCNFCDFSSYQTREFLHHLSTHVFMCTRCPFKAYTRSEILLHAKKTHGGLSNGFSKFELCKIGELSKKEQLTRTPHAAVMKQVLVNPTGGITTTNSQEDISGTSSLDGDVQHGSSKYSMMDMDVDMPAVPLVTEKTAVSEIGNAAHLYRWQCSRCKRTFHTSEEYNSHEGLDGDSCVWSPWTLPPCPLSKKSYIAEKIGMEYKAPEGAGRLEEGLEKDMKSATKTLVPDESEFTSKYDYNIAMMKQRAQEMMESVSHVISNTTSSRAPQSEECARSQHVQLARKRQHTLLDPCLSRFVESARLKDVDLVSGDLLPKVKVKRLRLKRENASTVKVALKVTNEKKPFARSKYPQLFKCKYCLLVFTDTVKCRNHIIGVHKNQNIIAVDLRAFKLKKAMMVHMCRRCSYHTKNHVQLQTHQHTCKGIPLGDNLDENTENKASPRGRPSHHVKHRKQRIRGNQLQHNKRLQTIKNRRDTQVRGKLKYTSKQSSVYEVSKMPLKLQKVLREANLLNGRLVNLNFVSTLLVCNHCSHVTMSVPGMKVHLVQMHPFKPLIAWDFKARLQRQTNTVYYCPGAECKFVTYMLESIHQHRSDKVNCPLTEVPPADWGLRRVRAVTASGGGEKGEEEVALTTKRFHCRHCKFKSGTVAVVREHYLIKHPSNELIMKDMKRHLLKQKSLICCCPQEGCTYWCYSHTSGILMTHPCPMPEFSSPPTTSDTPPPAPVSILRSTIVSQQPNSSNVSSRLLSPAEIKLERPDSPVEVNSSYSLVGTSGQTVNSGVPSLANIQGYSINGAVAPSVSPPPPVLQPEVAGLSRPVVGVEKDEEEEEDDEDSEEDEEGEVRSEELLRCSNCSFSSTSLADMREHLLYQHAGPLASTSNSAVKKDAPVPTALIATQTKTEASPAGNGGMMYQCTRCAYMTTVQVAIETHAMKEHGLDGSYRSVCTNLSRDGDMLINVSDGRHANAVVGTPANSTLTAAIRIKKELQNK